MIESIFNPKVLFINGFLMYIEFVFSIDESVNSYVLLNEMFIIW
jgi:hypothetical protein